MSVAIIVVVALFVAFVLGGLALAKALRDRNKAAVDALGEKLAGRQPLLHAPANLFGQKSRGIGQIRGNGHLAVTEDALLFSQIIPARVLEVPRAEITKVATADGYLGKTVGRELLVVTWADDEAAWYVRDLADWVRQIEGG